MKTASRLTNARYKVLTGASRPTAKRDLEDLVEKGVLVITTDGRGSAYEVVPKRLRNGSNGSSRAGIGQGRPSRRQDDESKRLETSHDHEENASGRTENSLTGCLLQ